MESNTEVQSNGSHGTKNGVEHLGATLLSTKTAADTLKEVLARGKREEDDAKAAARKERDELRARVAELDELLGESDEAEGAAPARGRSARKTAAPKAKSAAPKRAAAAKSQKSERLPRRSAEEISTLLEKARSLLVKHKDGLRAEQIRVELGLEAKELPRILKQGLEDKVLRATGKKRATTYFAK